MNALFLTTQTTHHAYFVKEIAKKWPSCHAILEQKGVSASFETAHGSDLLRELYEIKTCLGGSSINIADLIETIDVDNINQDETIRYIEKIKPDIIVDFGTRRVKESVIQVCKGQIFNLHGGDPQHYRGLDSHIWAMYHKQFDQLKTTLHSLNTKLDDGDIVETLPISIQKNMKIHEFRRYNTETCIKLVSNMLTKREQGKSIELLSQKKIGRYYSFMPTVLKNIAAENFEKHTSQIHE